MIRALEQSFESAMSSTYLCVKARCACERFASISLYSDILSRPNLAYFIWKVDCVPLMTCQAQCVCVLAWLETQGNDTHSN